MALRSHFSVSNIVWRLISAYFLNAFYVLYTIWNPPACIAGQRCIEPLFDADTKIDLYVYSSTTPKPATRMTASAFRNKLTPIWNSTGLNFSAEVKDNVTVPILPETRNNGSLYAHVIMVRAGQSPFPGNHTQLPRPGGISTQDLDHYYHQFEDLVYARGQLTRYTPMIGRNRTMLLGSNANESAPTNDASAFSDDMEDSVINSDGNMTASPQTPAQLLSYGVVVLGLSAMAPANIWTASIRFGIIAIASTQVMPFIESVQKALEPEGTLDDVIQISSEPPTTHWKGQLDINIVQDFTRYNYDQHGRLPSLFTDWSERHGGLINRFYKMCNIQSMGNDARQKYAPWLQVDEFSLMSKFLTPLSTDSSKPDPVLVIQVHPHSRLRFQVIQQMASSSRLMMDFGFGERDLDEVKQLIYGTSLEMLALTYIISILHMMFDYLAFKNDVGFFQNRKDYKGISGRTLLSSFISQVIITLYLMDNEYTSRFVLVSVVIGTVIEGWKVLKVMRPTWYWAFALPWVRSAAPTSLSKGENETNDIDAVGFKYLTYAMYPLVGCWAVYSLFTEAHKSWWSWAIHALAYGVYTFGFILMTPQLFINYKLKSVAHLPWRVFMYKAFNTFIDDVFSFIMVMPTAHRIACLRDDVVFFVYLYQRYLYPVDMKRANEFGYSYEEQEKEE